MGDHIELTEAFDGGSTTLEADVFPDSGSVHIDIVTTYDHRHADDDPAIGGCIILTAEQWEQLKGLK